MRMSPLHACFEWIGYLLIGSSELEEPVVSKDLASLQTNEKRLRADPDQFSATFLNE